MSEETKHTPGPWHKHMLAALKDARTFVEEAVETNKNTLRGRQAVAALEELDAAIAKAEWRAE